MTQQYFVI